MYVLYFPHLLESYTTYSTRNAKQTNKQKVQKHKYNVKKKSSYLRISYLRIMYTTVHLIGWKASYLGN